ncbi:DUF551 domain-containing protein [Pantoea dispersa]|uniref:DUF551 domain-containing protein n=1 Tax=Pantoea dispersa TaxID=59814 RepID=UPI003B7DDBF8
MNNFPAMTEERRQELIRHNRAKVNAITPQFLKESTPGVKKHLQREIDSAKIAIAALTADGWIKCSEQMPEDDTLCLGFDVEGIIWTAHYDCGFLTPDCGADDVVFTHWMPLPSPPEERNEQ